MSSQDELLAELDAAGTLGGHAPPLEIGSHKVAIKRVKFLKPAKAGGVSRIVCDVVVVESTVHAKGEIREWVWFVGKQGHRGEYEKKRFNLLAPAIKVSIDDTRTTTEVNKDMLGDEQKARGVVLKCDVTQAVKDGKPMFREDGSKVTNATWAPVKQTLAQVAATRAQIDQLDGVAPAAAPAATAPAPQGILG